MAEKGKVVNWRKQRKGKGMTRRKRPTEQDPQRKEKSEGMMMLTGMKEWRQHHPTATLREIEEAMEERLAKLRAGMLEELIHMSPQATWRRQDGERKPRR